MAAWWQHLVLSIDSPQPGCEQPEDGVTHVCFTAPCNVPRTSEADLSPLIHAEVCSTGQKDLLPCEHPGQEGKCWLYLQGGKSSFDKGSLNKGKQ